MALLGRHRSMVPRGAILIVCHASTEEEFSSTPDVLIERVCTACQVPALSQIKLLTKVLAQCKESLYSVSRGSTRSNSLLIPCMSIRSG